MSIGSNNMFQFRGTIFRFCSSTRCSVGMRCIRLGWKAATELFSTANFATFCLENTYLWKSRQVKCKYNSCKISQILLLRKNRVPNHDKKPSVSDECLSGTHFLLLKTITAHCFRCSYIVLVHTVMFQAVTQSSLLAEIRKLHHFKWKVHWIQWTKPNILKCIHSDKNK